MIFLDKTNKKILFELDKNARQPASKIAKTLNLSREIVKYRIQKLVEKKVITAFRAIINPSKLGFQLYKLHFKIGSDNKKREAFLNYFRKYHNTFWVGSCEGKWDIICSVFVKNTLELYTLMHGIMFKFREFIIQKEHVNYVQAYFFPKSFLTNTTADKRIISEHVIQTIIDEIDKKLLSQLSKNARSTITKLAQIIGQKEDTIRFRMKRLEKKGIVLGYRTDIDLQILGKETYKVFILFSYREKERHKELHDYISRDARLSYYLKVLGSWDAEAEFIVENKEEVERIITTIKEKYSDLIRSCESVKIVKEFWTPNFSLE